MYGPYNPLFMIFHIWERITVLDTLIKLILKKINSVPDKKMTNTGFVFLIQYK